VLKSLGWPLILTPGACGRHQSFSPVRRAASAQPRPVKGSPVRQRPQRDSQGGPLVPLDESEGKKPFGCFFSRKGIAAKLSGIKCVAHFPSVFSLKLGWANLRGNRGYDARPAFKKQSAAKAKAERLAAVGRDFANVP
jgi:hypothetical protein